MEAGTFKLRLDGRFCGKHCVNVRGNENAAIRCVTSRKDADCVSNAVSRNLAQADAAKMLAKPFGPRSFAKGRGRHCYQLLLPAHDLLLMQMQPAKGLMYAALRGKMAYAREGRGWGRGRHKSQRSTPAKCRVFHETAPASVLSKKADLA